MMVPTKILPLLTTGLVGWGTKLRMGLELLRAPKPRAGDESVAEFIEEHYGAEAVDYLAEPLLCGIYGGNPGASERAQRAAALRRTGQPLRQPDARRAGGARQGKIATARPPPLFRTLKGGLGQMVDAVARSHCAATPKSARCAPKRSSARPPVSASAWRGDWLEAGHLVVACEAHSAAPLLAAWTRAWPSCWARCPTARR